jgi:DNA-binding transcriptional regulator YiaG
MTQPRLPQVPAAFPARGTIVGARTVGSYIVSDMEDDDLPVLPGFREMALSERRRQLLAELVAHRRATGLSQAEVAGRMGTSQPAVARLETGAADVRLSTLQRYAAAVGRRLELRLGEHRPDPPTGSIEE